MGTFTRPLYIMQSNGGSLTAGALRGTPVRMIESGPAAGVLGAAYIGRMTNQLKVISFDMGGTTAKAGIVEGGVPRIVPRFQAGEWLISTPSLDLVEIGAGLTTKVLLPKPLVTESPAGSQDARHRCVVLDIGIPRIQLPNYRR